MSEGTEEGGGEPSTGTDTGTGTAVGSIENDEPLSVTVVAPDDELRAAVGAPTKPRRAEPPRKRPPSDHDDHHDDHPDDGDPKRPRNWRVIFAGATAILVGLVIATLVFLGRANSDRYLLTCDAEHVGAEQGRAFPPWGARAMTGAEWAPIAIRPETECRARETGDAAELAGWYLDVLVDQATVRLTARDVTDYEAAFAQLQQALLLARSPDRRDQRKDIERMLGDVDYWRATHAARKAADDLAAIAKQYDSAAAQRPRHVSDAAAWAAHLRHVVDELRAGPNGAPSVTFPTAAGSASAPDRAVPPLGSALPVEAGGNGSAVAPTIVPPAPPDAGVSGGGVLL